MTCRLSWAAVFLLGCNLNSAGKTACSAESDCDTRVGEVCADHVCLKTIACGTHFDCDLKTICQDGFCQGFTVRNFGATVQAMGQAFCNAQLADCGPSQMQKAYGSNYAQSCVQAALGLFSGQGQQGSLGPGPTTPDKLDAKMAAACVYDMGQGVSRALSGSFINLPVSCNRMVAGALPVGADCFTAQSNCQLGLECAFGPTLLDGQLVDFVCLKAFGQAGDTCATPQGAILSDCDVGLYCDWGRSWKCQPRVANAHTCPAPFTCSDPTDTRCQVVVNPCIVGDSCDSTSTTCTAAKPFCPLGQN